MNFDVDNSLLHFIARHAEPYLPSGITYYLSDPSLGGYSSVNIAIILKTIQVGGAAIICLIFSTNLYNEANPKRKYILRLIASMSILTCLLSFNPVALERYYMATVMLSIYAALKLKIHYKTLVVLLLPIFLNTTIHGLKTMSVMFTSYDYYIPSHEKFEMATRPLYYPTVLLLNFDKFGQSDEILMNKTIYREKVKEDQ